MRATLHMNVHLICAFSQALHTAQRRCEELEEALNSRSQVLEMLQQEVSSADQQKQVQILMHWMPFGQRLGPACWQIFTDASAVVNAAPA